MRKRRALPDSGVICHLCDGSFSNRILFQIPPLPPQCRRSKVKELFKITLFLSPSEFPFLTPPVLLTTLHFSHLSALSATSHHRASTVAPSLEHPHAFPICPWLPCPTALSNFSLSPHCLHAGRSAHRSGSPPPHPPRTGLQKNPRKIRWSHGSASQQCSRCPVMAGGGLPAPTDVQVSTRGPHGSPAGCASAGNLLPPTEWVSWALCLLDSGSHADFPGTRNRRKRRNK